MPRGRYLAYGYWGNIQLEGLSGRTDVGMRGDAGKSVKSAAAKSVRDVKGGTGDDRLRRPTGPLPAGGAKTKGKGAAPSPFQRAGNKQPASKRPTGVGGRHEMVVWDSGADVDIVAPRPRRSPLGMLHRTKGRGLAAEDANAIHPARPGGWPAPRTSCSPPTAAATPTPATGGSRAPGATTLARPLQNLSDFI